MKEIPLEISNDQFVDFLNNGLPNNFCIEPIFQGDNILIRKAELSSFEDSLNGVIWQGRTGGDLFTLYLEHKFYSPYSNEADKFRIAFYKWNDMIWVIASIPKEDKANMEVSATYAGLRLADGVPCVVNGPITAIATNRDTNPNPDLGIDFFPLNTDDTFHVEFEKESDSYQGPGGQQDRSIMVKLKKNNLLKELGLGN